MRNYDRAVAYAKQRGVEIPKLDDLDKDLLRHELLQRNVKMLTKATRPMLVERLTVEMLMPHLTPTQRRRIRQCDDSSRTLRDRKGRKVLQRVSRRRRIWNRR